MATDILTRAEQDDLNAQIMVEISAMLGRRRMKQAALARALGVSPMWVSDRMTGRVRLTLDDLDRISAALRCEIVDLLPRSRRTPTLTYPDASTPAVSGTVPQSRHPVLAGAAALPYGVRRTAPTGR
jgi:DNA-binding Xre family transcriptional regulator